MDEMYGIHSTTGDDYSDKALMCPDNNLINIAAEYNQYQYYNESLIPCSSAHHHNRRINDAAFESEEYGLQRSVVSSTDQSASIYNVHHQNYSRYEDEDEDEEEEEAINYNNGIIKAKIASHPSYPKLLDAYIDCQKVGAPPEISYLLDEIRREKDDVQCKEHAVLSMSLGVDPELDEFMETYCDVLVKYKSDLSRPFDEATSFLNTIETQLANLCKDTDGALSSDDEEFSIGGETEILGPQTTKNEDRELKDKLLRRYGNHINNLKLEFSKKKKKGKLPKEARQTLLEWWSLHNKWPYPTETDKISLAEKTGLDQKQINNWFINQRKRHWKPSENMHLAMMDNLSSGHHFFMED